MAPPLKPVRIPLITPELCELVGAIAGDGSIQKGRYGYRLSIVGNLDKDYEYIRYLSNQIEKLFGLKSELKINRKHTLVNFLIYSKNLCEYFIDNFGFVYGKKAGKLYIPSKIRTNPILTRAFVRGLFDTDGCVTEQRMGEYRYPVIKISSISEKLVYDLKEFLTNEGLKPFVCTKSHKGEYCGYDLVVKSKGAPDAWIELIGSTNPRNIKKLEEVRSGVAAI